MPALILFLCLVSISFNLPAAEPAPASSFVDKTSTSITGYDAELEIRFSSHLLDDGKTVLLNIGLGDKQITNRVDRTDPKKMTFELKAVNVKTRKLTSLNAKELRSLSQIGRTIGAGHGPVHDVLSSTIALVLSTDPDGEDIDFSSQKIEEELRKPEQPGTP